MSKIILKNINLYLFLFLMLGFFACNFKGETNSKNKDTVENDIESQEELIQKMKDVIDASQEDGATHNNINTNRIKGEFSSNLRPQEAILENHLYIDTIEFSRYDDNGDYYYLIGKKDGGEVAFIYNWDWRNNKQYNFKSGDMIKVQWKMFRAVEAGDEEIVIFSERAIVAELLVSNNKAVKFLWRADEYDEELKQEINSIFIDESFCHSMSIQEKAALGYVATFIGNECMWDGKADENRSNLRCKILTALELGYQCSDKHLGFLKKWFSQDAVALEKLEECGTMPFTASVQTTFDEIFIFTDIDKKTITINYKTSGVNLRENATWGWTRKDEFEYDSKKIKLINSEKIKSEEDHKSPESFVPKGYVITEKNFGDLNNDGQEDCILIVKGTEKNNFVINRFDKKVDRNRRGIIVLFKNQDGYQLAVENYECFLSENEDGGVYYPPELWVGVEKGILVVHYAHGRYGFWKYKFRYQDMGFALIGYDASSNHGPVINSETSINFLSKKKLTRENTNPDADGSGNETFKETWKNIEIEQLLELSKIKDFEELDVYKY